MDSTPVLLLLDLRPTGSFAWTSWRPLAGAFVAAWAGTACDPTLPPGGGCADGVVAESCDDRFCGDPDSSLAAVRTTETGALEWTALAAGSPLTLYYGPQGGFHISGGIESENLCSVVYLDFLLEAASPGGGRVTVVEDRQHVQALRCERLADDGVDGVSDATCTTSPTMQRWWNSGRMLNLPCDYRPRGDWFTACEAEPVLPLDETTAFLTVTVSDHDGRSHTSTVEVQPECCEE